MRTSTLAMTAAIALGVSLAGASAAQAARPAALPVRHLSITTNAPITTTIACASLCAWTGTNFHGESWPISPHKGECWNLSAPGSKPARSAENRTGRRVRFYAHAHCGGSYFDLPNGYHSASMPATHSIKVL